MLNADAAACPLCGTSVGVDAARCPSCGLFLTVARRPNPFVEHTLWAMVGGLAVVYLLTLLVVVLAR
ncbi:MAG TPA: hypothetical protein VFC33_20135 [Acidimicrobiia bacterium]|nr:hypothetical protein [Acidimicrobiia bacterium]